MLLATELALCVLKAYQVFSERSRWIADILILRANPMYLGFQTTSSL